MLGNRNAIMILGLVVGLAWGKGAIWTEPLTLPALAAVMTVATMGMDTRYLRSFRGLVVPALTGILMNYLILTGIILVLNRYLISNKDLWSGFVIIAAVPPAVAIIPFTFFLRGDGVFSLLGTFACYLAALVIMPVMAVIFFGSYVVSPLKLLLIMAELIFLPLIAGRFLVRIGLEARLDPLKGPVTNWCFGLVTYTIIGLNREMFLFRPLSLVPTALIVFASTFVLGSVIEFAGKRLRLRPEMVTSLVLLGTLKNYGIAGGLALALFSKETSTPATVSSVFMIVYIIWLEWKQHRSSMQERP